MTSIAITAHASIRGQQRGVPPLIREWLLDFGEEVYDHHGAIIYYFTRDSRRRLERNFGRESIRRFHEWLDSYAVVSASDGLLISVGKRYKKVNH
jgi:hypothetical protein